MTRPEGGAKARPRIGDEPHDRAVRIEREQVGDDGDHHDGGAGDPHEFPVGGVLAEERLVEVVGDRGGGDKQLGIGGAHRGGEDGGEQDARDEAGEEAGDEVHEDDLRRAHVGVDAPPAEEGDAHDADEDGRAKGDEHPDHRDDAALFDHRAVLDRHEAHEDVRHAEVPEAPDEAGDDRDERDPAGTRRRRG